MRTLGDKSSGSGGAGGKHGESGGKGGGGETDLGDFILSPETVVGAPTLKLPGIVARLIGVCVRVTFAADVSVPAPTLMVEEARLTSLVADSRAAASALLAGGGGGIGGIV